MRYQLVNKSLASVRVARGSMCGGGQASQCRAYVRGEGPGTGLAPAPGTQAARSAVDGIKAVVIKGRLTPEQVRAVLLAGSPLRELSSTRGGRDSDCLNNNNNRRLVTLAEHTSDHGRQTNSSTEEKGEQV